MKNINIKNAMTTRVNAFDIKASGKKAVVNGGKSAVQSFVMTAALNIAMDFIFPGSNVQK